jgi:hypothetical protein
VPKVVPQQQQQQQPHVPQQQQQPHVPQQQQQQQPHVPDVPDVMLTANGANTWCLHWVADLASTSETWRQQTAIIAFATLPGLAVYDALLLLLPPPLLLLLCCVMCITGWEFLQLQLPHSGHRPQ